jgi:hypothetical protein
VKCHGPGPEASAWPTLVHFEGKSLKTAQPTNTPADDAPYWDAALETQTRADWDALKLELLKAHLQHAYNGSPYYRASFDTAGVHPGQVSSLEPAHGDQV